MSLGSVNFKTDEAEKKNNKPRKPRKYTGISIHFGMGKSHLKQQISPSITNLKLLHFV